MHTIFNSRSLKYKSPFGAVKHGESVTLTMQIPLEITCETPHVVFCKDGSEPSLFEMEKIDSTKNAQVFKCTFVPDQVGIYFYYFDLYSDFNKVFRSKAGASYISKNEGLKWQLTVYDKNFTTPDNIKGGIMYQIFPDRFFSAKENDTVPFEDRILRKNKNGEPYFWPTESGGYLNMDYFGGDFAGIQEKLPYLQNLGVTIIYLNPIFEAHANHRYNTANYLKADPMLGTNEEFAQLCSQAKKYNITIIIDGVFSHTGSDSVYFNKERRYGEGGAYNDLNSTFRQWFDFSDKYKSGYRSWWGFDTLPEVNENDISYRKFICDEKGVIDTWMKLGAGGFRLDVADELPDDFIEDIRIAIKKHGEDKYLLGEVWEDATDKISYGKRRTYLWGKGLDATMNYPFKEAALAFCKGEKAQETAERIMTICENYPKPALDVLMNFMSTHDTVRAITALMGESCEGKDRYWQSGKLLSHCDYEMGIKKLCLAYAMIYTLPGIPCVYYGDEIAMQGYKDPFNRAYYNWNNSEQRVKDCLLKLAKYRRECSAFKNGDIIIKSAHSGVLSYDRVSKEATASICFNRTGSFITTTINNKIYDVPPYDFVIDITDNR